jgi:hypothetical protein
MHIRFLKTLLIFFLASLASASFAQPFDLLIPTQNSPDTLSKELRSLQELERDFALEKLTRTPSKLEAWIELGELRLAQGKLQEAKRFFEMALEISPDNAIAKQGLVMVHYHRGEFNQASEIMKRLHDMPTISDQLKEMRGKVSLSNHGQTGLMIREDDRGISEIVTSAEAFFPSRVFGKLTGKYRYENWTHKDNGDDENSQVFIANFNYQADEKTSFSAGYAPEIFSGRDSIAGYHFQMVTGSDNLKIAASANRQTFRENLLTVRERMSESNGSITLFGDLHPRTKAFQTITLSQLSDGNMRRRYDAEMMHFIYRDGAPFLSVSLVLSQMSYDKQDDGAGNYLNYWSPSDYRGAELTFSWERSVGSDWWWGIDTSLTGNSYKFSTANNETELGGGAMIHLSYDFGHGRIYASLGDRIHEYFRERKLQLYGSFDF